MSEAVVATVTEAERLDGEPALILETLREFLDAAGLGSGELSAQSIGEGHSNLTFLLRRGRERLVLRRPPRGELSPSANDVLRESRVIEGFAGSPVPVPEVLGRCEDPAVIGAPFFLMSYIEGLTVNDAIPAALDEPATPTAMVEQIATTLAALHAVDLEATGLAALGRPSGYLERQLRRLGDLLAANATRPLPDMDFVTGWLGDNRPDSSETTFVHGDYRLGNLLFATPLRLAAVLDWEMATVGDPLADLGYLTAMWASAEDPPNPMFELSRTTARPGFPGRDEVAAAYAAAGGREIGALTWYQVLALWKSAIVLEGSYRRLQAGDAADPYFASLGEGVPAIAREARRLIERTA
jgi:aminoglycoside phosphotransferase (APT) family kinase protein